MRRLVAVGVVAAALSGCGGIEMGGAAGSLVPANMVPDPAYQPSVGHQAVLYSTQANTQVQGIPLLKDMTSFDIYERALQKQDTSAVSDLDQRGNLLWTPHGTRTLVLAIHDRTHTGSRVAVEVKLLDGPQHDGKFWTAREYVTRLRPAPTEE